MDTEKVSPITPEEAFAHYRHLYLRVNSQGQNLLTASTFLTGLTFASFAMLVTNDPIKSVDFAAIANTSLGVATVLFLLTAMSTFWALGRLANLSPHVATAMNDGTSHVLNLQDLVGTLAAQRRGTAPAANDSLERDLDSLTQAYHLYTAPARFMTAGFVLLFLSLLVIGWHLHPIIAFLLCVPLAYYVYIRCQPGR